MTFREYLDMRIDGYSTTATEGLIALSRIPNMPAAPQSWPDLRAWLRGTRAHRADVVAAEGAWRAYMRHLKASGIATPTPDAQRPRVAVPGATAAVTDAPVLERLRDLGHEWRMVGRQLTAKDWDWAGDLTETTEKHRYLLMLREHETITQVSYFPPGECFPVLFARIKPSADPAKAYKQAASQMETSSPCALRWAITGNGRPMAGLREGL